MVILLTIYHTTRTIMHNKDTFTLCHRLASCPRGYLMVALGFGLGKLIGGNLFMYSGKVKVRCLTRRLLDEPHPILRNGTLVKQTLLTIGVSKVNFNKTIAIIFIEDTVSVWCKHRPDYLHHHNNRRWVEGFATYR